MFEKKYLSFSKKKQLRILIKVFIKQINAHMKPSNKRKTSTYKNLHINVKVN